MNYILVISLSILTIQQSVAPPVNTKEKHNEHEGPNDVLNDLEYKRYAQEVMNILESDPVFTARVNASTTDDIKSGKIADELEFLSHHVRNKLDEAKRAEISRLTEAINRLNTLSDSERERVLMPKHLDHGNLHTFEKDDLKKLITQLHKDIEAYDEQRKKQFKEYEMEKKFERELKMKGNAGLNETELEKLKYEYAAQEEKHKKHEPLHHPGSKQQLEEVWEKEDHMEGQDFNPKTFFYMHDIDGNGFWDPQEVNALFEKELDKLYQEGHPEDDLIERAEEMERMREHFMKEADTNNDSLISLHEYLEITKSPKFEKDEGWESIDQQKIYTEEEYHEFERRRQEELARQQAQYGHGQVQHPGMSQQVPYHGQPMQHQQNPQYQQHQMPQYQQIPQHQMPQYQQAQHNQMPQYQQVPHNNQMPQYQQVPQQYQQVPHNEQQQQYQQYQQQHPQQQHGQQPIQGQINQHQQQAQVNQQQQQQQGQVNQQQQQGQVNQQQQQGQVNQQQPAQVNQQQQQQHNPEPQQAQQAQQNPPVAQGTGNLPNSIPDVKKV